MEKNVFKKSLIIAIMLLLIGINLTSVVSGLINKYGNQIKSDNDDVSIISRFFEQNYFGESFNLKQYLDK